MPIVEGGKSAPSLSLAPPLDSQDVSRFKAVDPSDWDRVSIVERGSRLPWLWVFVIALVCACVMAAALIVGYGR